MAIHVSVAGRVWCVTAQTRLSSYCTDLWEVDVFLLTETNRYLDVNSLSGTLPLSIGDFENLFILYERGALSTVLLLTIFFAQGTSGEFLERDDPAINWEISDFVVFVRASEG
jgi:hypothetical protein